MRTCACAYAYISYSHKHIECVWISVGNAFIFEKLSWLKATKIPSIFGINVQTMSDDERDIDIESDVSLNTIQHLYIHIHSRQIQLIKCLKATPFQLCKIEWKSVVMTIPFSDAKRRRRREKTIILRVSVCMWMRAYANSFFTIGVNI